MERCQHRAHGGKVEEYLTAPVEHQERGAQPVADIRCGTQRLLDRAGGRRRSEILRPAVFRGSGLAACRCREEQRS